MAPPAIGTAFREGGRPGSAPSSQPNRTVLSQPAASYLSRRAWRHAQPYLEVIETARQSAGLDMRLDEVDRRLLQYYTDGQTGEHGNEIVCRTHGGASAEWYKS